MSQQQPPQQSPYPMPYPPAPGAGYSPPTEFWPYYLTPPEQLLGPARRASLMLFLLGALMLLAGSCGGLAITGATDAFINEALAEAKRMNPQQADMLTPGMLRGVYGAMAALVGAMGIVAIILGVTVRGGGRVAAIITLVLLMLPTLGAMVMLFASLIGGVAAFLGVLLILILPLVMLGLTIYFLIDAIRVAPQVDAARYQMQMAHHQQQAQYQAYAQQPHSPPPPPR